MRLKWKQRIPGSRPLATPAIADGRLFLGGGFGSHEFYAFDAKTGAMSWKYHTHDDGPTAAVVADGCVVFNTESCELEVLTLAGKPVWKKRLGDPLMSTPAVAAGRIYIAYPDCGRDIAQPHSRGNRQHYLGCFDLHSGRELWKQPIAGDVITAPTIADGEVYLATLDGTLYCFGGQNGKQVWTEKTNATSSPVVWKKRCFYSRRQVATPTESADTSTQQHEELTSRETTRVGSVRGYESTRRVAHYLDFRWRSSSSTSRTSESLDGVVGFSGHNKGSSKMWQAMRNLGHGTVHAVWSHQGSKPFIDRGRMFSAMGDTMLAVDPDTECEYWRKQFRWLEGEDEGRLLDTALTPPALVNGKVFFGTVHGRIVCLSADGGQVLSDVELGEPIAFQPAVAGGRVYVVGARGGLYCLDTGDANDDGWLMWGATAAHNGMPQEEQPRSEVMGIGSPLEPGAFWKRFVFWRSPQNRSASRRAEYHIRDPLRV